MKYDEQCLTGAGMRTMFHFKIKANLIGNDEEDSFQIGNKNVDHVVLQTKIKVQ